MYWEPLLCEEFDISNLIFENNRENSSKNLLNSK